MDAVVRNEAVIMSCNLARKIPSVEGYEIDFYRSS